MLLQRPISLLNVIKTPCFFILPYLWDCASSTYFSFLFYNKKIKMKSKVIVLFFFQIIVLINCVKADEWQIKSGNARDIAVGANGAVWSIGNTPADGSYNIQFWTGSSWQNTDGGGVRIAVDPNGNPWVINNQNQVFRRENNIWIELPGKAVDIGIGADGSVWKINVENPGTIPVFGSTIQKWNGTSWIGIAGVIGANRISVGPNGQPFVVTVAGSIHEKLNGGNWIAYPGSARDIAVGANGSVWVIGNIAKGGGSYSVHKWNAGVWDEVDGGGTQIAVDPAGKPWITNHASEIYKRAYTAPAYNATASVTAIVHDYPYAGRVEAIAANPNNQNHLLAASAGGVYETFNATASNRSWVTNSSLASPNVSDLVFATVPSSFIAWAAVSETFKRSNLPQIWEKQRSGFWRLATFAAGVNVDPNKTSCHRVVKGPQPGTYYACGDFGIAYYGLSLGQWELVSFPPNIPVYSIAALKNGTVAAATATGTYIYSQTDRVWTKRSDRAKITTGAQRYRLNTDFNGQIIMFVDMAERFRRGVYTADGLTWGTFNLPPEYTEGAAGGFESIYLDSLITGNYSIFISNKFEFYQANFTGASALAGLDYLRNNQQQLQWGNPVQHGHPDTRHFLKLRGNDGANKIVITSDGGFHVSNFNYSLAGSYNWQTEKPASGLNNLEVYNLTGTSSVTNFGTQHNGLGALSFSFSLNGTALAEGYVLNRQGLGDTDPRTLVFDNKYGLSVQGQAMGTAAQTICGTTDPFWNSPNRGWGNPIWIGNRIYIQDAEPVAGLPDYPWKISMDNGCNWQNLPAVNAMRKGSNVQFSVKNNVEHQLYVGLDGGSGAKLARLINPNIKSMARWDYPTMNGMDNGIALLGADFYYVPVFSVSPINPNNMYAVENITGKLKKMNDGGSSWIEATSFTTALISTGVQFKGNKGDYQIKSIKFSPYDPNLIIIGTATEGLFISRNSGSTWNILAAPGLLNVTDFHWRSSNSVVVATYGHGLFHLTL